MKNYTCYVPVGTLWPFELSRDKNTALPHLQKPCKNDNGAMKIQDIFVDFIKEEYFLDETASQEAKQ